MRFDEVLLDVADVVFARDQIKRELFILGLIFLLFLALFVECVLFAAYARVAAFDFLVEIAHCLGTFPAPALYFAKSLVQIRDSLFKVFLIFLLKVQVLLVLAEGILLAHEVSL